MISTKKAYELLLASAVLTNVAAEALKKMIIFINIKIKDY